MHHAFGGKTGTTNSFTDAWFIGFSPSVTCGTWIGFDNRQSLGDKETGAKAALPMWMDFMKVAVADKPDEQFSKPNAPKKQLDVPVAPAGDETPVKATKPEDDPDAAAGEDAAPKAVAAPPVVDALPADEGGSTPPPAPVKVVIPTAPVPKAAAPVVTVPKAVVPAAGPPKGGPRE
jgi:penicillin-binding protein 1A